MKGARCFDRAEWNIEMPVIQSTFGQQVASVLPGQLMGVFNPRRTTNRWARGLLAAGRMAFRVPASAESAQAKLNRGYPGEVYQLPVGGLAADVDAIGTVDSSTGTKTIASGVTPGVVAGSTLQPARKLTVTFDASTDWDATNGTLNYVDLNGQSRSETVAIATSTSVTSLFEAKSFVSFVVPAQTGAGGAATIGITALDADSTLVLADCVGIVQRQFMKTMVNPSNLYIGPSSDGITNANVLAHYVDGDTVPCLYEGSIVVATETAVAAGDPVYVRLAASGGLTSLGMFANAAGTGLVLLPNAKFPIAYPAGAAEVEISSLHG